MKSYIMSLMLIGAILAGLFFYLRTELNRRTIELYEEIYIKKTTTFAISFKRIISQQDLYENYFFKQLEALQVSSHTQFQGRNSENHSGVIVIRIDSNGLIIDSGTSSTAPDILKFIQTNIEQWNDTQETNSIVYFGMEAIDSILVYMLVKSTPTGFILSGIQLPLEQQFEDIFNMAHFFNEYYRLNQFAYLCWQDDLGIIAASPPYLMLNRIEQDTFLQQTAGHKIRRHVFQGQSILEVIIPFAPLDTPSGILRLGFYPTEMDTEITQATLQLALMLAAIWLVLSMVSGYIWHRQKINWLNQQYYSLSNYTGLILEMIDDGIIVIDGSDDLRYSNPALGQILGFIPDNGSLDKKILQELLPWAAITQQTQGELQVTNYQGDPLYLLFSGRSIQDSRGATQRLILLRNLTSYKKLEEKSRQIERLSLLGKISSMMAHEIRNPLNTISMIIQRLQTEFQVRENTEEFLYMAQLISREVLRLNQLVKRFLEYGRLPLPQKDWFPVRQLFNELEVMIGYWSAEKPYRFTLEIESTELRADREQLFQALLNLCQNAWQALPEEAGVITIEGRLQKKRYLITITDNGEGIPDHLQSKVFDLYFTTKKDGSGFGLPITQRIIEDHGGHIEMESKPAQGTRIMIDLPLASEDKERR